MISRFIKLAFLIFTFSIFIFNLAFAQMFWNQACQFAGTTSSYITVPNSSSINLTGSFSIEVWVNPSSLTGIKTILSKGILGSDRYGLQSSSSRFRLFTNSTIRIQTKLSTIIPLNQWTHIAGTYNSSTNQFRIYVNGILDSSTVIAGAAPIVSTDSIYIGTVPTGSSYSGQMDELRLWNRELSSTEVSQYFRTTLVVNTGIYSGLLMAIPFQGNQSLGGFTLTDFSSTGNTGINRGVSGVAQFNRPLSTIMPNESVELDGTEDYLACADSPILSPTTGITLEAWVYPRNTNPQLFVTKGSDYRLGYNGAQVTWGLNNVFFSTGVPLILNRWSHFALTYSAATEVYAFYLDGVLRTTATINIGGNVINGTDSLFIGGGSGGFPEMNGYIDEVRISSYAKSQTTINKFLYQSIEDANQPDPGNLQAVYSFDGIANSGSDGAPTLAFRNNARFSHPGSITNQPVSPLNRNDNSSFSKGYYMKTANKRIPATGTSGSILDSTIVNLNATITDVNFFIALNHTNSSNLDIVLVGPNNDSVKVFDSKVTKSSDDNVVTVFNDQADSSLINNRYATFSTVIKPENNMNSTFNGDNSQGRWKLIVRDEQTTDTGFLYAWGIQINNLAQRPKDLDLSVLVQGFYKASTNLLTPDTMRVYLRNGTSPFAIIDSSKVVLTSSGLGLCSIQDVTGALGLYIQLKHRNSIETWSNPFSFVNDEASYSFLNAASSAFGNNQIQVDNSPVRFAIYGGDVNRDGVVDATDAGAIDNDAFNFVTGYVQTDVTGDNVADASDAAIADNNAANFVTAVTP